VATLVAVFNPNPHRGDASSPRPVDGLQHTITITSVTDRLDTLAAGNSYTLVELIQSWRDLDGDVCRHERAEFPDASTSNG